jgi:hypothetical protein
LLDVAWRSESSADRRCRVTVQIDAEPEGIAESVGDALGFLVRPVTGDLARSKAFIERSGSESGGWRALVGDLEDRARPLLGVTGDPRRPPHVSVVELRTCLTPSMNCGNPAHCVHWLYAVRTGTSTSTASMTLAILPPNLRLAARSSRFSASGARAWRGRTRRGARATASCATRSRGVTPDGGASLGDEKVSSLTCRGSRRCVRAAKGLQAAAFPPAGLVRHAEDVSPQPA